MEKGISSDKFINSILEGIKRLTKSLEEAGGLKTVLPPYKNNIDKKTLANNYRQIASGLGLMNIEKFQDLSPINKIVTEIVELLAALAQLCADANLEIKNDFKSVKKSRMILAASVLL